jgi:hypothetical protein
MNRSDAVTEVVEAIAEAEGIEPQELEYSLYQYVDPEAIEGLVEMDDTEWELTFSVPDHEVTVSSNGGIRVDGELVRQLDTARSGRQ